MNVFKKIFATLRLESAIQMADLAHAIHKDCFYVLPNVHHRLIIFNRHSFRKYKQKGYYAPRLTMWDVRRECFYFTPDKDNRHAITPALRALKRKQYFQWFEEAGR